MKIEKIMNIDLADLSGLTDAELAPMLRHGKDVLIQRYKRQKTKMGKVSPYFKQHNPYRLRTTNLTHNEMVNQLKQIKRGLAAQTTTVKGYKLQQHRIQKAIKSGELNAKQENKLYDAYNKILELNPALTQLAGSQDLLDKISEYIENHQRISIKNIDEYLRKWAQKSGDEFLEYYEQNEWQSIE